MELTLEFLCERIGVKEVNVGCFDDGGSIEYDCDDDDVDGGGSNEIGSAMLYLLRSIFGKYRESLAVYSFYNIYMHSLFCLREKESRSCVTQLECK